MGKNTVKIERVLFANVILAILFVCVGVSAQSGAPPSASSLFASPASAPEPDEAGEEPESDQADDEPESVQEVAAPAPAPEPEPVPEQVSESVPEVEVTVEFVTEKKEKKEKVRKEKPDREGEQLSDFEKYGKPVKFGARLAYNNTYVPQYSITTDYIDMPTATFKSETYSNSVGLGTSGFEFGAAADIRLAGPVSLNVGLNFAYRNPVSMEVLDIGEFALGVPVLARYVIGPVFIDAGAQADIPFGTKLKWAGGEKIDAEDRSAVDVGAVLGFGYKIIPGLSLDIRGIVGALGFDSGDGGGKAKPIYQASAGVSYLY